MNSENLYPVAEAVTDQSFTCKHLPLEIIIKIYGYLPLTAIQNASLACTHWYSASLDSTVLKKKVLRIHDKVLRKKNLPDLMDEYYILRKYYKSNLNSNLIQPPLYDTSTEIMDSILPYEYIKMSCNSYRSPLTHCLTDMDFWKRMAKSLKNLEIDQVHDGDWQNILNVLSHLENLESLCLNFNKFEKILTRKPITLLSDTIKLRKLTFLDLHMGHEHEYIQNLFEMVPEIIHFHLTISVKDRSFDIAQHVFDYLNNGKKRIKTLCLNAELSLIRHILNLRHMNLETIVFNEQTNINMLQTIVFFTDPTKLLRLAWKFNSEFNNFGMFVEALPFIQTIVLDGSNFKPKKNPSDMKFPAYLQSVSTLKNQSILKNLVLTLHPRNTSLFRDRLNMERPQLALNNRTFENMGYLTTLQCSYVEESLNDEILQNIFKYLTLLKCIRICSTPKFNGNIIITDYGFTGEYSISNLIYLETLDFNHISSRLGDPTLIHISKLKQLRHLDIYCKEGSELAVENLRKCCPLLENDKIRLRVE